LRIFLILLFSLCLVVPSASASSYVDVTDDVYNLLLRLEAEGVITSGLLTTKPISYKEITRLILEAERNSEEGNILVRSLIQSLKERLKAEPTDMNREITFIKPLDLPYARYVYADSGLQSLYYNMDGDHYEKGSNLRAGFSSRAELRWLSLHINPEFRYSEDGKDFIVRRAYGVLNFSRLALTVGKDSQWWGPGYHGSILLSNNAEPLTMLRLTNPHPVLLPWIFKYLGPFRFTVFATRLEKERVVSEAYLWGMRLNFKPIPYLELGLQRTALLGGKGRSESMNTWWKSFTGSGENEKGSGSGDQRAGFDIKLTLPMKWQPLQLYAEAVGEDESAGWPYKWAYLAGIYLPRVLNFERIDLRAEYATTHVSGSPNVWYNHNVYKSGYTYKGRIIGHHMGTDSKDIFTELSYYIHEKGGKLSVSYDREEHNLSGKIKEKKDEATLEVNIGLAKNIEAKTSYSYGRIKNMGNISAEDKGINTIMGLISYNF